MAVTTTGTIGANYLQTYMNKTVIKTLEEKLYFYEMGQKATMPKGYNTVSWAKYSKMTVSPASAALTEWTTPTEQAFSATVISATPSQYGLFVYLSDRLLQTDPLNALSGAGMAVGNNLARIIDEVIQTEVMAGTNVRYADWALNRAALTTSNVLDAVEVAKLRTDLVNNSAEPIWAGYVAISHPNPLYDLRTETGTGNWLEVNKYVTPEKIFRWEVWMLSNIRFVESPHVKTFASGTTVYPVLALWEGAYGVTELHGVKTYTSLPKSSENDPLAQRGYTGAKADFVAKRLQEDAMVRLEVWTSFV